MNGPLPPGAQRSVRAPLSIAALILGGTLSGLAITTALLRNPMREMASDPLVVRSLAATIGVAAFMLARAGLRSVAGPRRPAALLVSLPVLALGIALLTLPSLALVPYARGWDAFVPWIYGVPGVLSLVLGRWRIGTYDG